MKDKRNLAPGERQYNLILDPPVSNWEPPSELPDLRQLKHFALDTEERDKGLQKDRGPGWATNDGKVIGISVAWYEGERVRSFYAPLEGGHEGDEGRGFPREQVAQWLTDHRHLRWIMFNAPYDLGWLMMDLGVPPPSKIHDAQAMAFMVDEERPGFDLDSLAGEYGLMGKEMDLLEQAVIHYANLKNQKRTKSDRGQARLGRKIRSVLHELPSRYVGPYAEWDAALTLLLAHKIWQDIERQDLQEPYLLELELIPLIMKMKLQGIKINFDQAEINRRMLVDKCNACFAQLKDKLGKLVGMQEIGSPKWLQREFDAHKIEYPYTAKGHPSFTAGSTGWMHKDSHWLPQLIVQADKYNNCAKKFIEGFIIEYAHNGRLHPQVNTYLNERGGARSHRLSYSDPALQQMHSRDEELKAATRGCFEPEDGEEWCELDYAQQEYRLICHHAFIAELPKAAKAVAMYAENPKTDFHSLVSQWTGLERKPAKDTNFAKSYGAGVPKFAHMINKSEEEAAAIYKLYDKELPFVSRLYRLCDDIAQERGWIKMVDGAKAHFNLWEPVDKYHPKGLTPMRWATLQRWLTEEQDRTGRREPVKRAFTKDAMNRMIQGSGARMTKLAMREAWKEGIVPLLQMHDALSLSDTRDYKKAARLKEIMENVCQLSIPMLVDMKFGPSWGTVK